MTAALTIGRYVSTAVEAFVRHVRTEAGVRRYGVPIGSPIPVGRRVKPRTEGEQGRSQAVRRAPTVKSEAGAKRYGVPVGSPIPIGRKVKKKPGNTPAAKAPESPEAKPAKPANAPETPKPPTPIRRDIDGAELSRDYRKQIPDLTYEQQGSVRNYTGSDYGDINNELRGFGGGGSPEDLARIRKDVRVLSDLANQYRTPGTVKGHRSLYDDRHLPTGDLTGQVITSPGFSSVAVDKPAPGYGHGNTHMEITIPPGTHGIDVGGTGYGSFGGDEREFILPHNTRYRIDSQSYRDVDGIRQRVLKVTALPPLPADEGAVAA